MTQPNESVACMRDPTFNNGADDTNDWSKSKPMSFAEQLEKWNKVRQSLYSQNGWCSTNVNQISKWDVGDLDANPQVMSMQEHSHETGTNIWNANLSQQATSVPPCSIGPVPQPDSSSVGCAATQFANTNSGAIPKMFDLGNLNNCLNFEIPYSSPSQTPQLNANVFHECDTIESNAKNMNEVNLALHLKLETMHLDTKFSDENISRPSNMTQISNICQISNQYQVDCSPHAFS